MKKFAMVSLSLICINFSVFAASFEIPLSSKSLENDYQELQVVNVCNLMELDLNAIMQGNCPKTVFEFSTKTVLPLKLFLKGDLINLIENDESQQQIEVMQTFYVRCVEDELIFSTNLTDWKPFLESITGNASIGLDFVDGKPSISFGSETNLRS